MRRLGAARRAACGAAAGSTSTSRSRRCELGWEVCREVWECWYEVVCMNLDVKCGMKYGEKCVNCGVGCYGAGGEGVRLTYSAWGEPRMAVTSGDVPLSFMLPLVSHTHFTQVTQNAVTPPHTHSKKPGRRCTPSHSPSRALRRWRATCGRA